MTVRVLMVCLGNICRSPTAEGVLRAELEKRGLTDRVEVDSAGTAAWHIGKAPDVRSQACAKRRGIDISGFKARQVISEDFLTFDYVLAMDRSNLQSLQQLKPAGAHATLGLLLGYGASLNDQDVPDPYYGEQDGFERVLNLIEAGVSGLVDRIVENDLRLAQ